MSRNARPAPCARSSKLVAARALVPRLSARDSDALPSAMPTHSARSRRSRAGRVPVSRLDRCQGTTRCSTSAASGRRASDLRSRPTASSSNCTTSRARQAGSRPSSRLGLRLQFRRAARRARRSSQRRRTGRDAIRGARTGLPRRLHDLQSDPAQRAGGRAQGHPPGRLRPDRESRRRHPEGRHVAAAAAADRPRRAAAVGDAGDLPDLRDGAGPRRRGSGLAVREHQLSGPPASQPRALRLAARHELEGFGASLVASVYHGWSRIPPTSTP